MEDAQARQALFACYFACVSLDASRARQEKKTPQSGVFKRNESEKLGFFDQLELRHHIAQHDSGG
jgi:hypothetical protein